MTQTKEPIWIQAETLRITDLRRTFSHNRRRGEKSWTSCFVWLADVLRLGPVRLSLSTQGTLDQVWDLEAKESLLPSSRLLKIGEVQISLAELLSQALAEATTSDSFRSFMTGSASLDDLTLRAFEPRGWQGGVLEVPIVYLEIADITCRTTNKPVTATVVLGHHLTWRGAKIFDRRAFRSTGGFGIDPEIIKDPKLHEQIVLALRDWELRKQVARQLDYRTRDRQDVPHFKQDNPHFKTDFSGCFTTPKFMP